MAEWFNATVLKTVAFERGPGVRIPLVLLENKIRAMAEWFNAATC